MYRLPTLPRPLPSLCSSAQVFAFLFSFSFLYPASRLLRDIVREKELRMREGMKAMGLGTGSLLTSWYITYALMTLFQAIVITIITSRNIFQVCGRGWWPDCWRGLQAAPSSLF